MLTFTYIGDITPAEEFEEFKVHLPHSSTPKTVSETSKLEDLDSICKQIAQTKPPPKSPRKREEDELDQINLNVQGIDIQREPSEEEVSNECSYISHIFQIWNKLEQAETAYNERISKKRKLSSSSEGEVPALVNLLDPNSNKLVGLTLSIRRKCFAKLRKALMSNFNVVNSPM